MSPADFPTFGTEHNAYLIGWIFLWLFIPIVGKKYLNQSQRLGMVIFLAVITVFQDIIFDFFQLYINDFDLTKDLPLHMCGLSLFLTAYALWTKNQTAFLQLGRDERILENKIWEHRKLLKLHVHNIYFFLLYHK